MDELAKRALNDKIKEILRVDIHIEDINNGFSFYIDRAHLCFENNDGAWTAYFHKTYFYEENGEWKKGAKNIDIDEYEFSTVERKEKLHAILKYLNSPDFEEAQREYINRVACETLDIRGKMLSFNELKTTVIGTHYCCAPTFPSHRDDLIEGIFPDYENVCVWRHEATERVDFLYNDFFSEYNTFVYSVIDDFELFNKPFPYSKGFADPVINQIIEDYRAFVNANKPDYVLDDDEVRDLLSGIKHKCLLPAITNDDCGVCTCLWMVKNVSDIPLLLFIAMHKNVFGFHSDYDALNNLNFQSFFWDNGKEIMFCAYVFAGAKQISRFTGFERVRFNSYGYGQEDWENNNCSLPKHLDVFNK